MYYCGIDPGKDGGVCVLTEDSEIAYMFIYDDCLFAKLLCSELNGKPVMVCIEDVHAVQGSKAKSTFNFGINTGRAQGIIIASCREFDKVLPQIWKKEYDLILGEEYNTEYKKQKSIDKAHELWPKQSFAYRSQFMKDTNGNFILSNDGKRIKEFVDHDGVCEAALIAEWVRRKNLNLLTGDYKDMV